MKPIRTCVICKEKFEKDKLNRIVVFDDKLHLDTKKNMQSKSAYICNKSTCHAKIEKQKPFNRVFKQNFSQENYQNLLVELKKETADE